jgi:hypothetical protein
MDTAIDGQLLALCSAEHPEDQGEQRRKEQQQEAAERQSYRPLLFWFRLGYAKGPDEALDQEIQQFHSRTDAAVSPCKAVVGSALP